MGQLKCKNSVFCVLFFFSFSLGTICGVLLFRLAAGSHGGWLLAYCGALPEADGWSMALSLLRPLAVAALAGLVPWGRRCLPWLIGLRGLLMAYAAAACFSCGQSGLWLVLRGLALLPVYFAVCRWVFGRWGQRERSWVRGQSYVANVGSI